MAVTFRPKPVAFACQAKRIAHALQVTAHLACTVAPEPELGLLRCEHLCGFLRHLLSIIDILDTPAEIFGGLGWGLFHPCLVLLLLP